MIVILILPVAVVADVKWIEQKSYLLKKGRKLPSVFGRKLVCLTGEMNTKDPSFISAT